MSEPIEFEKALEQLEALVEKMESGELSLEDSLLSFEKGISLTRQCNRSLSEAEQTVKMLMEKNGQDSLVDAELDDEE